jgi:hypothetical protein
MQFFIEFQDPITRVAVRDPYKIAINYFKGRFSFDALTIIPFTRIFQNAMHLSRLFYCVKVLRLSKGYYLLDTGRFKQTVRGIYEGKLNQYIKGLEDDKEATKENIFIDQTQINTQMYLIYAFRFFKLIIFILGSSYFVGMFWYIVVDLNNYSNESKQKR